MKLESIYIPNRDGDVYFTSTTLHQLFPHLVSMLPRWCLWFANFLAILGAEMDWVTRWEEVWGEGIFSCERHQVCWRCKLGQLLLCRIPEGFRDFYFVFDSQAWETLRVNCSLQTEWCVLATQLGGRIWLMWNWLLKLWVPGERILAPPLRSPGHQGAGERHLRKASTLVLCSRKTAMSQGRRDCVWCNMRKMKIQQLKWGSCWKQGNNHSLSHVTRCATTRTRLLNFPDTGRFHVSFL